MALRAILVLATLAVVALSAIGAFGASVGIAIPSDVSVGDSADGVFGGPPPADERLKTTTSDRSIITNITLYASGRAEIHLTEDHSCYDQLRVTRTDTDSVYKRVPAPEFSGPAVIDLRQIVKRNGPYPDSNFKIAVVNTDKNSVCIGSRSEHMDIVVPEAWHAQT